MTLNVLTCWMDNFEVNNFQCVLIVMVPSEIFFIQVCRLIVWQMTHFLCIDGTITDVKMAVYKFVQYLYRASYHPVRDGHISCLLYKSDPCIVLGYHGYYLRSSHANMGHCDNAGLILVHRLRRWSNIKKTSAGPFYFKFSLTWSRESRWRYTALFLRK